MSIGPIKEFYRAHVPTLLQDVIRKVVIQPALTMEMVIDREVHRHFPEGAEPHIQALLRQMLKPGDTFVDVGANFGALSSAAARLVAPGGTVICFEPVPANFSRLTGLLEATSTGHLKTVLDPRAVGAETGPVEIHLNFWDGLHTIDPDVNAGSRTGSLLVQQVTLDDALRQHGVTRVDLLKIDVEGAELRVLRGAHELLRSGRIAAVVLEVCNPEEPGKADNARQIAALLQDAGFTAQRVGTDGLSPWNWRECVRREDVLFTRSASVSHS
ncbi:MAG: FkbM family methyltransferase [Polyangia bacterium]